MSITLNYSTKTNLLSQLCLHSKTQVIDLYKIFPILFNMNNTNSKHNCKRNNRCDCIFLGNTLIKCAISFQTYKSISLINLFNTFYEEPQINLPYALFYNLMQFLIKTFQYQTCIQYINAYISNDNHYYFINLNQKEALLKILYSDCSYGHEIIYNLNDDFNWNQNTFRAINNRNKLVLYKVHNDQHYLENAFNYKETKEKYCDLFFLGKISSMFLNKKMMYFLLLQLCMVLLYKIYNKYKGNLTLVSHYINKINYLIHNCKQFLIYIKFNVDVKIIILIKLNALTSSTCICRSPFIL